jgi:hypothetical protein
MMKCESTAISYLSGKKTVPKVAGLDQLDVPPSGESVY